MGAATPKQYLPLLGKPLLAHTLEALAAVEPIASVVLVLSPEDEWFDAEALSADCRQKLDVRRCGGASRAESVRNGLRAIAPVVASDDWVLVHDAARPCVAQADVLNLIDTLCDDEVGGILAVPVADTLKRADLHERITATVPREALWRAQTPQMFRHGLLLTALERTADEQITDEASAMEAMGLAPRLVRGNERNIKVTYPADLTLAAGYLQSDQVD
ncbi:MAG: 2-C-methyl-D-erythritol 4-phosphate cytidylyltransferase [Burkholderiales bacterium]|nr:2-C-methyl-D-erythritol 4-phosphate cytidylyltransferase [Burkholderiales bacterium]